MLLQKNWSMGMFMGRVGITIKDSKNRRSEGEGSKGEKRKEGLGKDKKEEHRTQNPELRTLNSEPVTHFNFSSDPNEALKYSRFRRAILATEIPFGHSASQA